MHSIDAGLLAIEKALEGLSAALRQREPSAIDEQAQRLHVALQQAVSDLNLAARRGELTPELRERLGRTSGQIARQQDVLTRASVSLDRLLGGLLPATNAPTYGAPATYGSAGMSSRAPYSG